MSTVPTSLKMPESLKKRIARLAKESGESPHALMLRLLDERVSAAERYRQFLADGKAADEEMQTSGLGYDIDDVHRYLEAKVAGKPARKPKPVQWRE